MVKTVQLDTVGFVLEHTYKDQDGTVIDISSATTQSILLRKPDGHVETKTSSNVTDGTDGKADYTTVANDLDQKGTYRHQGKLVIGGSTWYSEIKDFSVAGNLA